MSNPPEVFPPHRPNVILITFDSLAAQNMSLYGYDKVTTPHLDAFAKKSFVFKNVFANCNSTIPSLISILTGKYPFPRNCRHLISLLGVKGRSENIASVLRKEGYHISAVLGTLTGYPIVSGLHFLKTAEWTNGLKSHVSSGGSTWLKCSQLPPYSGGAGGYQTGSPNQLSRFDFYESHRSPPDPSIPFLSLDAHFSSPCPVPAFPQIQVRLPGGTNLGNLRCPETLSWPQLPERITAGHH